MQSDLITFGKPVQSQTFKVAEMWCVWSVLHFVLAFQVRNRCLNVADGNLLLLLALQSVVDLSLLQNCPPLFLILRLKIKHGFDVRSTMVLSVSHNSFRF
jgi:hypothetical protein